MGENVSYDRRLFAENLLRLMRANGETQADVARLLQVSKSTVSSYCAALQTPRMDKVEQLAVHYGVSRAELLGDPTRVDGELGQLLRSLNAQGREELLRYARYLAAQPGLRARE